MNLFTGIAIVPFLGGALLFVATVLIVLGAGALLAEREFFGRRLAFLRQSPAAGSASKATSIALDDGLLKRFEEFVTPKDQAELTKIRRRLINAGYRRPSAVRVFYAAKGVLCLGAAVVSGIFIPVAAAQFPLPIVAVLMLILAVVGYFIPSFWVERTIEYRRQTAELGFPDLLDMLLICIEAGNSLDQALRRVAREIKTVNAVLADELGVVNDELYAGKSRAAVFRDFADRLAVSDITAFAAVLRQSDEYGVSIADTLRVYASELRNKRVMRAEEKANMMPVKLALGSIAFTIPPALLIMAGPSIIMILRTFAGLGGH
jgi:tight adherence protein C